MRRTFRLASALLSLAAFATGCGKPAEPGSTSAAAPAPGVRQAELKALEEAKAALDQKRAELVTLRERAATDVEARTRIEPAHREIATLAEALGHRLVDFLNADLPVAGKPWTEEQRAAIRIKSSEDLLVAKEHIELGGDYERAIAVLVAELKLDPENRQLVAALADAEANRFMTADRFDRVKKGMSETEVEKLLGRPLAANVRQPSAGVVAWIYPKNGLGEAAGVFFGAQHVVYSTDFNAVRRAEAKPAGVPPVTAPAVTPSSPPPSPRG